MAPTDAEQLRDEIFDFVRQSEEAVIEVGRKWAASIDEFMPVEMPLVRDLTREVLDFVDELLRIQREFARQMVDETRRIVFGTTGKAQAKTPASVAVKRTRKAA